MNPATADDLRWLDAVVRYAQPYRGTTGENPAVGALIVDPMTGVLIARAVTAPGGRPHAAPQALDEAGEAARGKTLYVTLEPSSHWGRTPPSVDTVIRAGIARVVIGMADPDPRTDGKTIKRLIAAGIEVVLAGHLPSGRLHEGHTLRHRQGRPFVTLKLAVSADGMIGEAVQGGFAIVGDEAGNWNDMLRSQSDAVLIGAATAEADEPQLTVRLQGLERRTPLRVILSGARGVDTKLNLIAGITGHRVAIITTSDATLSAPASIEIIRVFGKGGRPDLVEALGALSRKGIAHLLVEGGAQLTEAFLASGLVDRFQLLSSDVVVGNKGIAASVRGSIEQRLAAAQLVAVDLREIGNDVLRTFEKPADA
ncbi:bifunctional diaminohydroxyphosphoribosylaminopyrimidine deaminase/5-amino-6-(5-phosphoribosylamino)uracil reductase RibD [Devosia sp.]|uniref:bifunctional diaminohydroxyphosphoribosylaminopyrimidine deaminase/5-amino-6-(5-phosphoribosylamino)uracil reductase RibD n=1 Tax=Devosia sp. TaxID=1871048 RepID=UPI003264B97C